MKIYPAIDILGGNAVRLKQGRKHEATVYGDPLEMAVKWVSKGADWLHVVDLDGAFQGIPQNIDVLRNMAIGIDARDGKVQVSGWTEDSQIGAIDLARHLHGLGARIVIYTDISRD